MDFSGDTENRESTTGSIFELAGGVVRWRFKTNYIVSLSTTEAEYVALSAAVREAIWLHTICRNPVIFESRPTVLYGDNIVSLGIAKESHMKDASKTIVIQFDFIREVVNRGKIEVLDVPSEDNTAEILAKILERYRTKRMLEEWELRISELKMRRSVDRLIRKI